MELTELCRGSFASDFWGIQEFPLPWLELATSDGGVASCCLHTDIARHRAFGCDHSYIGATESRPFGAVHIYVVKRAVLEGKSCHLLLVYYGIKSQARG